MLVGTLLSPYIFDAISYYGCYCIAIFLSGSVAAYLMFVVKEIPPVLETCKSCNQIKKDNEHKCGELMHTQPGEYSSKQPSGDPHHFDVSNHTKSINGDSNSVYTNDENNQQSFCDNFIYVVKNYIFIPFYETLKVVTKRRSENLRFLIILLISLYAFFWFAVEEMLMWYNYLQLAFSGFDGEDYAWFSSFTYLCRK